MKGYSHSILIQRTRGRVARANPPTLCSLFHFELIPLVGAMFFPLTLVGKLLIYRFFFLHGGGNEAACPTHNFMQHTKKHIRASRRTAYVF